MVVKPKRILWPTDFSSLSLYGGRYARGFCDEFGAALHVIHVIPPPLSPDVSVTLPIEVPATYSEQEVVDTCNTALDQIVSDHLSGVEGVVTQACFGNPWSMICEYAKEHEIDLIVVATHGRTGLQHVLIGSTAERIVQHAPCPVLVVKNPEKDFLVE